MLGFASHLGHLTVCVFGLKERQEAGNLSEEVRRCCSAGARR